MSKYRIGSWASAMVALLSLATLFLLFGALTASAQTPQTGEPARVRVAPLNPQFVLWQAARGLDTVLGSVDGRGVGDLPAPQTLFSGSVPGADPALEGYAASFDLRQVGKLTPVKNQGDHGTCWSFATCGSMESCLLPGESTDFSEDNLVLNSGFDTGSTAADKYAYGGHIRFSTAYLARWGGPVWESDDAYDDGITPGGLSPRKHVQNVSWYAPRASAADNDRIKYAITAHGGVYISMSWQGATNETSTYYNATTHAYHYDGSANTNHGVLAVGWDDDYAAGDFSTPPPGNGAFIVRNSWGTGWGENGYFYVSYYDTRFGRASYAATFEGAESITNYDAVYQYDPLGDVSSIGLGTTLWGANRFTATTASTLGAVGFFAEAPNTAYEVWEGPSTANLTKITGGTLPQMGFHTVTLPEGPTLTSGAAFVVAVKLTTPGFNYPLAVEYPVAGYSSDATASPGQSYYSVDGKAWDDLTEWKADANVCLKAYATSVIDTTPPVSSSNYAFAPDPAGGWHNTSQAVTVRASGGAGTGRTIRYSCDGGATWTAAAGDSVTATVTGEGSHRFQFYASDSLATEATRDAGYVNIDTAHPASRAIAASVKKGKRVALRFRVSDALPGCGKAVVKIQIRKRAGIVTTIRVGTRATNVPLSQKYRARIAKGTYTYRVLATDIAGNAVSRVGSARLVVK